MRKPGHLLTCCARCRGFAFSLFYSFMNMAALLCASVLDLFRVRLRHGFSIASLPANHFLNDGTRLLLFMGRHPAHPDCDASTELRTHVLSCEPFTVIVYLVPPV